MRAADKRGRPPEDRGQYRASGTGGDAVPGRIGDGRTACRNPRPDAINGFIHPLGGTPEETVQAALCLPPDASASAMITSTTFSTDGASAVEEPWWMYSDTKKQGLLNRDGVTTVDLAALEHGRVHAHVPQYGGSPRVP